MATDPQRPTGKPLPRWSPPPFPPHEVFEGRTCSLEPLTSAHAEGLFVANIADTDGASWTYLAYGPFASASDYAAWIEANTSGADPQFYAIVPHDTGVASGVASYLAIVPERASIEVGHIHYTPLLARGVPASEAMYLMAERAFDLGYRRYEWKCDALNAASRAAAQRYGFSYEGTFRHHSVYKGRNRDTAWFSITDTEWPAIHEAFVRWLDPSNFEGGVQRTRLSDLTRPLLSAIDPGYSVAE